MSLLPEIGTGRLVISGQEPEKGQITKSGNVVRRRKGNKSLLEISQNLQSIHHEDGKRLRSRSYDHSSGDEIENQERKKAKIDRSKSLGRAERKWEQKRKQPVGKENNFADENKMSKSKSPKRTMSGRRVRFDSSSDDSFNQKGGGKSSEFKSSTPKPKGVQYKIGGNKNDVAMETSPITSGEVSPTVPRKRAQPGTHKSRLEAARERAKVWTETWSDPGPSERSIDHDKVLKGQPVDPRRSRIPTDTARNKHAQYMNQDKQDGRPKAADKGRRLQSLPSKKESHASETEERPVISAPSKDQGQMDAPMPKINTLVPKDHQASSQPGTNTSSEPSPIKSKEPSISPTKSKEPAFNPTKSKEPAISPTKSKDPADSPRKLKEPAVSPQKREPENKPKETRRVEINVTGVAGRTTMDEDSNRDEKRRLPADDHGPVNPTPKPAHVTKPSADSVSPSDPNFKYYASEKQRAADGGNFFEDSPRVPSEKSSKTDKSWTTIKTKSSFPAAPTKSKTTYEFSQTPSLANSDKKRREVTIVDPKYVRKNNKNVTDDDDVEPFMHEYEFSHNQIKHHRDFRDMTDEEKIEYFRDKLHMKPEQVRELTFHPKVTEPKLIHHTYTGIETVNWTSGRIKSGKRPKSKKLSMYKKVSVVPPSKRKSAMLTKLQGVVYRHINKVYDSSPRDMREKQFFEKLAQIQINDMQHRYEMLAEKERKTLESKYRQREQLRRLRRKFEDDAWRRFMTQYVTSKVVEAEYRDRGEYGLPNDLNEGRKRNPYAVQKTNAKRAQFAMTPKRMQRKNQKKYGSIFKYNAGPVPKSGGKPLKFEGFDAVYIDTEDENDPDATTSGKPTKKRQNVEALMQEARRILDQSDDDTDYEDTPRKLVPARRSLPERPRHNRSRNTKHIQDDKSFKSSQSKQSTTRSTSYSKTPPRTMKELINQRKRPEAPGNRYKASNFNAMKADLLKDSDILNKNEKLKEPKSELPNFETSSKSDNSRHEVAQMKPQRDRSPEKIPEPVTHRVTTPVVSPTPAKSQVQTKTVTTTQVTTVKTETTTSTADDETADKKEWKVKEGNVYLDNMETQMAIETARDKIVDENNPNRGPSRASKNIDNKLQNGYSTTKTVEKPASRTPSRISFRGKQETSGPKDLRPPRAPSRSSLFSNDAKTNKPQGRTSRTSMNPVNENQSQETSNINGSNKNIKTETTVTENVIETVNVSNGKSTNTTKPNHLKDETFQPKSVGGSKINIRQESRRNSVSSNQQKQPASGRTSVVGIATSNGRVSPAIEKQRQPASRRESFVDKQRETVSGKGSIFEKSSVTTGDGSKKTVDKHTNGHIYPGSRKTDSDYSVPKAVVAKSINVSENVTENVIETTNSERSKNKQPMKRQSINEPKRSVDHSTNDLSSSKRSAFSERRPNSDENKEKPKQTEKPVQKRDMSKGKKAPAGRRSRSRTPQRKQDINGHGDIKMDRNEYEAKGHDGNRPSRRQRSGSKEGSSGGRRRSTSRGRKPSKSRKRSISNERKKPKKGSVSKSRFPDITKKDGEWKISARSPTQKVTRSDAVDEYTTERVITPKPAGGNQWKDLVEKYLRQPSPKVGRTDDRSLLDSNITDDDDDDDEMDIFKRAQMKYKLAVSQTDEEDSDDD
ncbi:uncharacterized protein LOC123546318 isoform X3 [Mercenaria mercenaria]|uniref:uncharacterized protein LOC123546318 isoform X3 n=1 Tax=Mercenaria mercenaria TaxID=6596 RepID=UPI00234E9191|nr:uncharacterized protein LOC123546318 isoform X3 [Mercenaria mercenaria]